ncbi:response regulator [Caulobacter sp. Root655]|uniref:response regulator n=1 Tax=Caulobacter sp. Root655 TaxID=1736578 RepID=UPI002101B18A|nr:response regulator [Caulobacter sp. Root655]
MIVEDELFVAMLVEDMLGDLGCAIAGFATSAVEAESIARTALIDFALLDVNLDGETSFAAADVLRHRDIPFAFVTGYGEQGVRGDLRNAPILSKPIDPRHLARVINAVGRD